MTTFLIGLLIGCATSLDNSANDVAYRCLTQRQIKLGLGVAVVMLLAVLFGGTTASHVGRQIPTSLDVWLGSALLALMGLWTIQQAFVSEGRAVGTGSLGFSEQMFIVLTSALSGLVCGFAVGFLGLKTLEAAITIGVCSFSYPLLVLRLIKGSAPGKWGRNTTLIVGLLLVAASFSV